MKILSIFLIALFLSGCISTPRTKEVVAIKVLSDPAGALVFDGDLYLGDTPLQIKQAPKALTIIKPGYAPVIMVPSGNDVQVSLSPSSPQAYNSLLITGVRFVYRADTGTLRIEPQNRPVRVGSSYIIRDQERGLDVQYTVTRIEGRLVYLETNFGANIVVPIIRVPERAQVDEIPLP